MTTRSAAFPLEASGFRIDAFGGDQFYSVSEFQAIGEPVPEPAASAVRHRVERTGRSTEAEEPERPLSVVNRSGRLTTDSDCFYLLRPKRQV
jgi:hypothetical protein